MTINHLNISSVWKLLITVCVWLKFAWAFSTHSSPALKRSSPAQNIIATGDERVQIVLSYSGVKRVLHVHVFESCLRNSPKKQKLLKKVSEKNFISCKDGPEKGTETR